MTTKSINSINYITELSENSYINIYPEDIVNLSYSSYTEIDSLNINISIDNLFGDMNNDSILNILDVILLANSITESNDYSFQSDINYDNIINILDVIILINIILDN